MVKSTTVGSCPKLSDDPSAPSLRNVLHRYDRGVATREDVDDVVLATTARVVREQKDAGIDIVTDGQIRWEDLISPLGRGIRGTESGGLLRYFDNNVYFRRTICSPPMVWSGPQTMDDWAHAASTVDTPVKAVLPGPVTAASLSVDEVFEDRREFALSWADVIRSEALSLQEAGAPMIQLDEPWLSAHPEDLTLAREALPIATEGLRVPTVLALYFGDVLSIWNELQELPVSALHVDVVSSTATRKKVLDSGCGKDLIYGVVDARNTRLELEDDVLRDIETLSSKVSGELYVAPSCGLEFLPYDRYLRKLDLIGRIAKRANRE
jgi:5-methyltetrahydropteroyltriglutamate--homocysteine methyltransferase